jgi:hypothetical protein
MPPRLAQPVEDLQPPVVGERAKNGLGFHVRGVANRVIYGILLIS